MSTAHFIARARRCTFAAALLALPVAGAQAQLQPRESQPGGVEARPSTAMPGAPAPTVRSTVPPAAPPPVMSAPTAAGVVAVPKPPAPVDATKAKDDGKADKGTGRKSKKSLKRAPAADGGMAPRAPASEATPTIPGDETRPGGVERAPTIPLPKQ